MEAAGTNPAISTELTPTLFYSSTFSESTSFCLGNDIIKAALAKDQLGFMRFLSGRISILWSTVQEAHYRTSKTAKRKSG